MYGKPNNVYPCSLRSEVKLILSKKRKKHRNCVLIFFILPNSNLKVSIASNQDTSGIYNLERKNVSNEEIQEKQEITDFE